MPDHEVSQRITRTRRQPTNKVFTVVHPMVIEIRARSQEDAEAILERSEWSIIPPKDTKNGVYLIKACAHVPLEEILQEVLGSMVNEGAGDDDDTGSTNE